MTLSSDRFRAYLFGALTGAFTALAIVADPERRTRKTLLLALAAVCGGLSVFHEERAIVAEVEGVRQD